MCGGIGLPGRSDAAQVCHCGNMRLQDEVQFVASLGSIKAACMKSKKTAFHQRYQQVMILKRPPRPLEMQPPCADSITC